MLRIVRSIFLLIFTILTFVEVRPISKLEQSLIRQRRQNPEVIGDLWKDIQPVLNDHLNSHLNASSKSGCERTTTIKDSYIEYCHEKILNSDGKSYSIKTSRILHKDDGTIIPLDQAESSIEIETSN